MTSSPDDSAPPRSSSLFHRHVPPASTTDLPAGASPADGPASVSSSDTEATSPDGDGPRAPNDGSRGVVDRNRPDDGGTRPREIGGQDGPEPTRYGDWEKKGRCTDF